MILTYVNGSVGYVGYIVYIIYMYATQQDAPHRNEVYTGIKIKVSLNGKSVQYLQLLFHLMAHIKTETYVEKWALN
jgi:hypothetical protein